MNNWKTTLLAIVEAVIVIGSALLSLSGVMIDPATGAFKAEPGHSPLRWVTIGVIAVGLAKILKGYLSADQSEVDTVRKVLEIEHPATLATVSGEVPLASRPVDDLEGSSGAEEPTPEYVEHLRKVQEERRLGGNP